MNNNCVLCGHQSDFFPTNFDGSEYNCPRCGHVKMTGMLEAVLLNDKDLSKEKYMISGVTRYRTEYNIEPILITSGNYDSLKDEYYVPRNLNGKLELLLDYISKKSEYVGSKVFFDILLDYPLAFSKNSEEFSKFFEILVNKGLIEEFSSGDIYILTAEGWNYLEDKKSKVSTKEQAFIAMWFTDNLDDAYVNGFSKAIKDTGYNPMRIDVKEHNNKIDDEMIAEIKNSAFLIADFTGQRGGVYFEAGFAKGLGIPVIWTCNKDDLKNLHFDTRQFNHIEWTDSSDLYTKLVNRIKATIK